MRIPMSRMKALLLIAAATVAATVVLTGCGGVGQAETSTSNGAGTTPPVDTAPPSTPTGLTGMAAGPTTTNLSWSASTDNVGGTAYFLLRNGVQGATPPTTSFADTGLSAATNNRKTAGGGKADSHVVPQSIKKKNKA